VAIPFEYHRFIIGPKGRDIRSLMDDHNVNIAIPLSEKRVSLGGNLQFGGQEEVSL